MDDPDSFDNICRLCMSTENEEMVPLFESGSELNCYAKAITSLAKISIEPHDMLPRKICQECLYLLKQTIRFKLKCEHTHLQFTKLTEGMPKENLTRKIIEHSMFMHYFPNEDKSFTKCSCENTNESYDSDSNHYCTYSECYGSTSNTTGGSKSTQNEERPCCRLADNEPLSRTSQNDAINFDTEEETLNVLYYSTVELQNSAQASSANLNSKSSSKAALKGNECSMLGPKIVTHMYKCETCDKMLANQNTLRNHKQRHSGHRFICEHCGKGFVSNVELQVHLVKIHETGKYLECQQCSFKAPRRFDLVEHMRLHTGERPFPCDKCGLTFRRRAIWRKHLLYHQEKKIKCPKCPRRFYLQSALDAHSNNVHCRLYMYVCNKCGATYAKPATVRRHLIDRHGVPKNLQGRILRINKIEQRPSETSVETTDSLNKIVQDFNSVT